MILSGIEISNQVKLGNIKIDPFDKKNINPNSYNLTLGQDFKFYQRNGTLDKSVFEKPKPDYERSFELNEHFNIFPGDCVLAEIREHTETICHVPMLEGRSSIGRQFCLIHVTAGFGDVGFCGKWTLEIVPFMPVTLWPGMDICQIYYHEIKGAFDSYNGRYQNNKGVQTLIGGGV